MSAAPFRSCAPLEHARKLHNMRDDRPPFLDSLLDELKTHRPYVSMAHAQRVADRLTRAYNDRPQADLGGLSPNQMRELLDADWSAPNSALMLDDTLSVDDVAQAPMVTDARFILDYVATHGPLRTRATVTAVRLTVIHGKAVVAYLAQKLPRHWLPAACHF